MIVAEHRGHRPFEQVAPGDALEPVAKVLRELADAFPMLHGKRVAVTFDGATATEDVEHGLGRAYTGGFLMDASSAVADDCAVITGATALAASVDTATYVRVTQGTAQSVTQHVWVY